MRRVSSCLQNPSSGRTTKNALLLVATVIALSLSVATSFITTTRISYRPRLHYSLHSATTSKTGGTLIETSDLFVEAINADLPVMVFWTAPWCGPCRLSIPVVKEVIKLFQGQILAYEVCTDDLPDVASEAGVVSIPTIHIYFKGQLLDTLVGCVAKQVLAGSVEKVLEDVQAQIGIKSSDGGTQ